MSAKTISPMATAHPWASDALLTKAQRFADQMRTFHHDEWSFAFWSALTLELLARAALAKVSPALLADISDWNNLYFALGNTPRAKRFSPRSISITEVLSRLQSVLPDFDAELATFCALHTSRRNAELHSGDAPFDVVKNSSWLALFYRSSATLLKSMGSDLKSFFGTDEAAAANKMIAAAADEAAKAVDGVVAAHAKVWSAKDETERATLVAQATVWATRHAGHRVKCPACGSDALVSGEPIAPPQKTIDGDEITEKQDHLPTRFECVACGLKLNGLSHLSICGLGDAYKSTQVYDAAEYYAPEEDTYPMYEEDNNEPV